MSTVSSDLRTRCLSALVLAALALFALFYHPHSFTMLLLIGGFIALKEWRGLNVQRSLRFLLTTTLYTLIALVSLWWLREQSITHVLILFAVVWGSDSAGYLVGKAVGGKLLCPTISPKKTYSGTIAALVTGTVLGAWMLNDFLHYPPLIALCIALETSAACIAGDLLESWCKRRAEVKDSGSLIPGHGGLLDRIDGLLLAAIVMSGWMLGWQIWGNS